MLYFPGSPHVDEDIQESFNVMPSSALGKQLRAFEHDERSRARRMRRCKQRGWCYRTGGREKDRLSAAEIVSTAVMLSAHCSKVGNAPGSTGSDAPVPGWSKKIS